MRWNQEKKFRWKLPKINIYKEVTSEKRLESYLSKCNRYLNALTIEVEKSLKNLDLPIQDNERGNFKKTS